MTGTFHYRDGIHFHRLDNPEGCVEIVIPPSAMAAGKIRVDADSWPSIVAAVSHYGETREAHDVACELHNGRGGGE